MDYWLSDALRHRSTSHCQTKLRLQSLRVGRRPSALAESTATPMAARGHRPVHHQRRHAPKSSALLAESNRRPQSQGVFSLPCELGCGAVVRFDNPDIVVLVSTSVQGSNRPHHGGVSPHAVPIFDDRGNHIVEQDGAANERSQEETGRNDRIRETPFRRVIDTGDTRDPGHRC